MRCSGCGTENEPSRKFCGECGAALARNCPSCGSPNGPTVKFCGECGRPLDGTLGAASASGDAGTAVLRDVPAEERRLVSVLFADLVGFTALSESRDAEEVREILSKYFDTCSRLIGRYGGVVEKFIGDAVMAVWGSPVATEDDAERAVRAALELVSAVAAFGSEVGAPGLMARAGVLTGEAAVTIGNEAEGMVLGDMVNTASRIQSVAEPGAVFVGESTRWASEAAIAFEDAGTFELKGKAEPLTLWRALRVTGGVGGRQSREGLEAPFVGRDRELRTVKETFHVSADERRAHLLSIVGTAGIGKSRLAWEFEKYFDGIADVVFWHRGRCPAYGDGLAYWALAEMVKMRCEISEEETGPSVAEKLRVVLDAEVPDPEERRWIEPRLASLIGLEPGVAVGGRDELFSAWRLFFERLADRYPVVMVFEDLQWADTSLLDFIEYLLEWSRSSRVFIVTLARPELAEHHPNWGSGQRSFASVYLEPLPEPQMRTLLGGLVPGLPQEVEASILERAQGVPLYAVETVRMLLDRGLLAREGPAYRPTGPIGDLEVPDTLHALIAARLDGLDPQERLVVQDGAVLGKSFFVEGVAAVTGLRDDQVKGILTALVRKELLTLQSDPRSPERGQYSFLQDLVKQVAYGTISKRDRKSKHLAAALFIRDSWEGDEDEVVEVVASHLLRAYELDPVANDAAAIKRQALDTLQKAGERAASLGASHEAQRYFEQAAELAESPLERAELTELAGERALAAGRLDDARSLLEAALEHYDSSREGPAAARLTARLAEVEWAEGRGDEAVERMEHAFAVLSEGAPNEDLATLAAQLGRLHFFGGEHELAEARLETALEIAEELWLPEVMSQAFNTKGILAQGRTRPQEAYALVNHALKLAVENDRPAAALRAYNNLAESAYRMDRYEESVDLYERGLALARRVGNRFWSYQLGTEVPIPLFMTGRWDDAVGMAEELSDRDRVLADVIGQLGPVVALLPIYVHRDQIDAAEEILKVYGRYEDSWDVQEVAAWSAGSAVLLNARGAHDDALLMAERAFGSATALGADSVMVKIGFSEAVDACFALGDLARARSLTDRAERLKSVRSSPLIMGLLLKSRARLAATNADGDVDGLFAAATDVLREIGNRYWLATTLTEHGEWCVSQDRFDEATTSLLEARGIFESAGATGWIERIDQASAARPVQPDRVRQPIQGDQADVGEP